MTKNNIIKKCKNCDNWFYCIFWSAHSKECLENNYKFWELYGSNIIKVIK